MNDSPQTTDDSPTKSRNLSLVLVLAIGIALVMTCVSVGVYYATGFYKLDLSRPGYEAAREDITSESTQKTYDTSSPVNAQAISEFLAEYDTNINALNVYGDFRDAASLSDQALSLQQNQ